MGLFPEVVECIPLDYVRTTGKTDSENCTAVQTKLSDSDSAYCGFWGLFMASEYV